MDSRIRDPLRYPILVKDLEEIDELIGVVEVLYNMHVSAMMSVDMNVGGNDALYINRLKYLNRFRNQTYKTGLEKLKEWREEY